MAREYATEPSEKPSREYGAEPSYEPTVPSKVKPVEIGGGAVMMTPSTGMNRPKGYATGALEGALGIPPTAPAGALTTTPFAKGYQKGEEYSTPIDIAQMAIPAAGLAYGTYRTVKPAVQTGMSALGFPLKKAVREFRGGSAEDILKGIESRTQDIIRQEAQRGAAQRGLATTSEKAITEAQKQSEGALNKIARPTNESTLGGSMRSFFEPLLSGVKTARTKMYDQIMQPVINQAKQLESRGTFFSNSEMGKAYLSSIETDLAPKNMLNLTREERSLLTNHRDRLSPIKTKDGLARVPIEAVDKEIRRLRDLASGPPKEGVDAITQQFAGRLADKLADSVWGSVNEAGVEAIKGFAPGGRMAKQVYRDMSVPVNQYKSSLGQQITGRFQEAPEFFNYGESTIPRAAFQDRESARQLKALSVGKVGKVDEFAAQHTANELYGKTAEQASEWLRTRGAYLDEFPTIKKQAENYVSALAKNEAEIAGRAATKKGAEEAATATRKRSIATQKDISSIKSDLQKVLTEAEPKQLREKAEQELAKLRQYGVFTPQQEAQFISELENIEKLALKRDRDKKIALIVGAIGASYPAQRVLNKLTSFPIGPAQ